MNQNFQELVDLLKTSPALQKKVTDALQNYNGDIADEKAFFDSVIIPLANEEGFSVTYEDLLAFAKQFQTKADKDEKDLSPEELSQIAGGKDAYGLGLTLCSGPGLGIGGSGEKDASACFVLGMGGESACLGVGASQT